MRVSAPARVFASTTPFFAEVGAIVALATATVGVETTVVEMVSAAEPAASLTAIVSPLVPTIPDTAELIALSREGQVHGFQRDIRCPAEGLLSL